MRNLFSFLCVMCILTLTKPEVISSRKSDLVLQQVVMLSRHGLRSPLSKYLTDMTPRKWPKWQEKPGYLTNKGAILEGYMGRFVALWLKQEGLITEACPTEDDFYVYANTKQRTRVSAKSFVLKAYPDCNITVHHSRTDVDPIFNPVIHNTSTDFKKSAVSDMEHILQSLSLNSSYRFLDELLDYKESELCKTDDTCDLITDKSNVYLAVGEKPNASGPLKIGNSVVDAFVMQYYEGFPLNDVAWGRLLDTNDWKTVTEISKGYHNVIFNSPLVANDVSKPLVEYMKNIFVEDVPKVTLLMGHDANMYTVMKYLRFKPYSLDMQYELAPIGGKLVFQKWYDMSRKLELLKVDYVYQSTDQLRDSKVLDLSTPPHFHVMEMLGCNIDSQGFCLWQDFLAILDRK